MNCGNNLDLARIQVQILIAYIYLHLPIANMTYLKIIHIKYLKGVNKSRCAYDIHVHQHVQYQFIQRKKIQGV